MYLLHILLYLEKSGLLVYHLQSSVCSHMLFLFVFCIVFNVVMHISFLMDIIYIYIYLNLYIINKRPYIYVYTFAPICYVESMII